MLYRLKVAIYMPHALAGFAAKGMVRRSGGALIPHFLFIMDTYPGNHHGHLPDEASWIHETVYR
jgi:hypothetical protein